MRFFLCARDTAGVMNGMAKGLRNLGHHVTTMVFERELYTPALGYDIERGRELLKHYNYYRAPRLIRGLAWRADVAFGHLINGLYTPSYLDHDVFVVFAAPWETEVVLYPILKALKKKVVIYYVGSEARHVDAFTQEFGVDASRWGSDIHRDPFNAKLRRVRLDELHADTMYSLRDIAGLQVRPYYHAFLPLDVMGEIETHVCDREHPVILHAPSRMDIKGTSIITQAIEELRADGLRFEFKVLTNVPRDHILRELRDADIVVDQLFFHGPGVLGAEAMIAGCALATRIIEPPPAIFAPPLCPIRPENVKARLKGLIEDRERRVRMAAEASVWARRVFDPARVAQRVVDHLVQPASPEYVPDFYLRSFTPTRRVSRVNRLLTRRVVELHRPECVDDLAEPRARGVVS